MRIDTSAQNRKDVVKAISELTGETARYVGPPTFSYQIGTFLVDREGFTETENEEEGMKILNGLREIGLIKRDGKVELINIEVPTAGMDGGHFRNLIFLIHSKQYLINRSFSKEIFQIPRNLIEELEGTEISDKEQFIHIFRQSKDNCKGIDFSEGSAVFSLPTENDPEILRAFTELVVMMVKQAREQKRINHKETIVENEKYYMRVWLLRLGFGGTGGKATRRIIMKNLKGHSAFRTQEEAQRAKERNKQKADAKENREQELTEFLADANGDREQEFAEFLADAILIKDVNELFSEE